MVSILPQLVMTIHSLDCAPTRLLGLSVTLVGCQSVRRSVRLEMFRGGIHIDVWRGRSILTVHQLLKEDFKPCSP